MGDRVQNRMPSDPEGSCSDAPNVSKLCVCCSSAPKWMEVWMGMPFRLMTQLIQILNWKSVNDQQISLCSLFRWQEGQQAWWVFVFHLRRGASALE